VLFGVADEAVRSLDGDEITVEFEGKRSTRTEDSSGAGSIFAFDSILLRTPGLGGLVAIVEALGLCGEMNKSDRSLVIFGVESLGLVGVVDRDGVFRVPNGHLV
jgi:hypothetical protein